MKKILGIVALTLIAGAPAFAADTSAIDYVLQVGGSNAGGPTVPYDTTNVVQEGEGVYQMASGVDIVNWSVKVLVSGFIDINGTSWYVGGAANLVWDLTLQGPDGQPVGTGGTPFGLGSASTAGFYSSIQDGSGLYKLQPAAFTWEFGGGSPYGRLMDMDTANGANMLQYTFPSTYSFYHNDKTDVVYNTTAQVLAPTGTLKGMGAGFQDFDFSTNGVERGGVGILADQGVYGCVEAIGEKAPIAEGQINLTGLPNGTYTLVLTPGTGNNVIDGDSLYCYLGTTGAFAMPAANVTGGTIQFVHNGIALTSPITLTIGGTVPAGGAWSIDGGATWNNSGATVQALAGTYPITYKAVAGFSSPTTPTSVTVPPAATLTSDPYVALPTPVVSGGAMSMQFHTGAVNAYVGIPLFAAAIPTSGNVVVEPRRSASANPWTIAVTFDIALGPAPTVVATGTAGAPTLGVPTVAGSVLSIPITAYTDVNLITLSITNVTSAAGSLPNAAPYVIKVIALQGDINNNRTVNVNDVNLESTKTGVAVTAATAQYDINCNGAINVNDVNLLSTKTGHAVAGTYP